MDVPPSSPPPPPKQAEQHDGRERTPVYVLDQREKKQKKAEAERKKWLATASKKDKEKYAQLLAAKPVQCESFLGDPNAKVVPRPFDAFATMGPDDFVIHNGTRRTGKTWLDRYLLYAQRHFFRCGEVFTNTPMNGFWQRYFPEWKVFRGWQPGVCQAIMDEQAEIVKLYKRFPDKVNPFRVIVLEDCANDLTHEQMLEDLGAYARHLCLSVHVITQHPQKLPPIVRSNADIVSVLPLHNAAALDCIYKDYLSTLSEENAKKLLTTYTWKQPKKSQALIINVREGNTLKDKLFSVCAPDPGPFSIGCAEYWEGKSTMPTEDEVAAWERENAGDLSASDDDSSDHDSKQ